VPCLPPPKVRITPSGCRSWRSHCAKRAGAHSGQVEIPRRKSSAVGSRLDNYPCVSWQFRHRPPLAIRAPLPPRQESWAMPAAAPTWPCRLGARAAGQPSCVTERGFTRWTRSRGGCDRWSRLHPERAYPPHNGSITKLDRTDRFWRRVRCGSPPWSQGHPKEQGLVSDAEEISPESPRPSLRPRLDRALCTHDGLGMPGVSQATVDRPFARARPLVDPAARQCGLVAALFWRPSAARRSRTWGCCSARSGSTRIPRVRWTGSRAGWSRPTLRGADSRPF